MQPQNSYNPNPTPGSLPPGYEFMAAAPQKKGTSVSGSPLIRIAIVLAGLVILVILFSVGKSILAGSSNGPLLLGVLQDQQQLIHLSTAAQEEKTLSTTNTNAAITTELSITSSRSELGGYMKTNKIKYNPKQLTLKINPATDKLLADATVASNYDKVFAEVLESSLNKIGRAHV